MDRHSSAARRQLSDDGVWTRPMPVQRSRLPEKTLEAWSRNCAPILLPRDDDGRSDPSPPSPEPMRPVAARSGSAGRKSKPPLFHGEVYCDAPMQADMLNTYGDVNGSDGGQQTRLTPHSRASRESFQHDGPSTVAPQREAKTKMGSCNVLPRGNRVGGPRFASSKAEMFNAYEDVNGFDGSQHSRISRESLQHDGSSATAPRRETKTKTETCGVLPRCDRMGGPRSASSNRTSSHLAGRRDAYQSKMTETGDGSVREFWARTKWQQPDGDDNDEDDGNKAKGVGVRQRSRDGSVSHNTLLRKRSGGVGRTVQRKSQARYPNEVFERDKHNSDREDDCDGIELGHIDVAYRAAHAEFSHEPCYTSGNYIAHTERKQNSHGEGDAKIKESDASEDDEYTARDTRPSARVTGHEDRQQMPNSDRDTSVYSVDIDNEQAFFMPHGGLTNTHAYLDVGSLLSVPYMVALVAAGTSMRNRDHADISEGYCDKPDECESRDDGYNMQSSRYSAPWACAMPSRAWRGTGSRCTITELTDSSDSESESRVPATEPARPSIPFASESPRSAKDVAPSDANVQDVSAGLARSGDTLNNKPNGRIDDELRHVTLSPNLTGDATLPKTSATCYVPGEIPAWRPPGHRPATTVRVGTEDASDTISHPSALLREAPDPILAPVVVPVDLDVAPQDLLADDPPNLLAAVPCLVPETVRPSRTRQLAQHGVLIDLNDSWP